MKERPILFSAPMVRAILDGSKTQTRRIVKSKSPISALGYMVNRPEIFDAICPYGKIGDRLWLRETFAEVQKWYAQIDLRTNINIPPQPKNPIEPFFIYRADGERSGAIKWKPSIHMPRRACRIKLEITNVRVERLQDISEEDAKAEGCSFRPGETDSRCQAFSNLWTKINGEESWSENPWVWVVEFKRVKP